jgi:hypothetical protein
MAEQTGGIAVSREALDLGDESGWYPFYVWRYAPAARADRFLKLGGHLDSVPPSLELGSAMRGGFPLDAVVLYGRVAADESVLASPSVHALQGDLDQYFRRVDVSREGNAELWLRKGLSPSC